MTRVREVYERAVAQVPPSTEKRHWRRYIFTWLNYALFEELETKDLTRAREIYAAALKLVPHKQFTFAKLWTQFAEFELRQLDLAAARKVMGSAIGIAPKEKLFKDYIQLELNLREFDRCRMLYQKWLEHDASNASAWIRFTELEALLQDVDRARALFELAISQPAMDMPELIWKSYIDFEFDEEEYDNTRSLYERLLERTSHVKVWVSFAQFEANAGQAEADALSGANDDDDDEEEGAEPAEKPEVDQVAVDEAKTRGLERARGVFQRGYDDLKKKGLKEERVVLLEAWKALEASEGAAAELKKVEAMLPRVVKKMRKIDGGDAMEEYYDMIFADDETGANPASAKFLGKLPPWGRARARAGGIGWLMVTALLLFLFELCRARARVEDEGGGDEGQRGRRRVGRGGGGIRGRVGRRGAGRRGQGGPGGMTRGVNSGLFLGAVLLKRNCPTRCRSLTRASGKWRVLLCSYVGLCWFEKRAEAQSVSAP